MFFLFFFNMRINELIKGYIHYIKMHLSTLQCCSTQLCPVKYPLDCML